MTIAESDSSTIRRTVLVVVAAMALLTGCADTAGRPYGDPELVGTFDNELVPEASGLAASQRAPGVLYLLTDDKSTGQLVAVRTDGRAVGQVRVRGMSARNLESLSTGPCGSASADPCLYAGDIGDNAEKRAEIVVHRIPEPDLSAPGAHELASETIRLRFPDGPHNAEALFVHDDGALYLIAKDPSRVEEHTAHFSVYRQARFADGTLAKIGTIPVDLPVTPLHSSLAGPLVTGAEYRDGRILVRTYDQVVEYTATSPNGPVAPMRSWQGRQVPSALEPQSEGIAWAADRCGYYTVGETVGDIWFVPCDDDRAWSRQ